MPSEWEELGKGWQGSWLWSDIKTTDLSFTLLEGNSLGSMWINNVHLAPPAMLLLPWHRGRNPTWSEYCCLWLSLFLSLGQQAAHRKHTFFSTAQCHKFNVARSVGKSAEFWGDKPIWLVDLNYSSIYYFISYKNDILISIIWFFFSQLILNLGGQKKTVASQFQRC